MPAAVVAALTERLARPPASGPNLELLDPRTTQYGPCRCRQGSQCLDRLPGPRSPRVAWAAPRPPFPLVDR